jgi:hypothetical protein
MRHLLSIILPVLVIAVSGMLIIVALKPDCDVSGRCINLTE